MKYYSFGGGKNYAIKNFQPRGKFIFQQLVANFADFLQNNRVTMQNNCAFKKYMRGNFIFRQLVAKNCEFSNFQ